LSVQPSWHSGATFPVHEIGLLSSGSSAPSAKPRLRIAELQPLVVEGTGFGPSEHVRLVVMTGEVELRQEADASNTGAFRAVFEAARIDRCRASVIVTGTGTKGRRARALLPERRCPPRPDAAGPSPRAR
ncbi:MAG TPA: hypothetical protein VIZ58_00410, partial [Thermoanaerobaculia bacterium]